MIHLRDLQFGYPEGGFQLRVPELRVAAGEKVALTGPSGSGKTTLVNLLAGILEPNSGSIEMAGLDLTTLPVEERQDVRVVKMGLVFQELELLSYLNVLENILLPYRLSSMLELDDEARARARQLAESVGLGDKLRRFPEKLSQGERQRVAVCRAMVTRPAIVLGDEPTGNLDADNRDVAIDALFSYVEEAGAPLIVVTHDADLVGRFDRIVDIRELGQ